ncbi:MAG: hypothetical protein ACOVMJ_07195, partial [Flavobacteriales bacterium]
MLALTAGVIGAQTKEEEQKKAERAEKKARVAAEDAANAELKHKEYKIVVEGSAVKDTTIKGNQDDTLHIRLGD